MYPNNGYPNGSNGHIAVNIPQASAPPHPGHMGASNQPQYPPVYTQPQAPTLPKGSVTPSEAGPKKLKSSKKKKWIWAVIILAAVGASIAVGVVVGTKKNQQQQQQQATESVVKVTFQSNQAKADAMTAAVNAFNNGNNRTLPSGKTVFVDLKTLSTTPLNSTLQPDIYSPVSLYWVEKENVVTSVDRQCRTLTSIPVGVAMWRDMAQSLGWPDKPISFQKIMDIAADPKGWASVAPEYSVWGRLKYGHGHLQYSNSGRYGIIAAVYSIIRNGTNATYVPLTADAIGNNATRTAISGLEEVTYHLGRSDNELLARMLARGKGYLHAIFTYESTLISYNQQNGATLRSKYGDDLVFIYPSDGTFWAENPICVLDNAPWTWSYEKKQAAQMFADFLMSEGQQAQLPTYGVRPWDIKRDISGPGSTIRPENGALPTVTLETVRRLPSPTQETMDQILAMWSQAKKPAMVVVLLDTSGSMAASNSMEGAKSNLKDFVNNLSDHDYLLPMSFGTDSNILVPAGRVADIRNATLKAIDRLYADGQTSLYQSMFKGLQFLQQNRKNLTRDGISPYNYALVVMTDGEDTAGGKDQLMAIMPSGEDPSEVHLWAIAYGNQVGATTDFFNTIATQTNGKSYNADMQAMQDVWTDIGVQF